MSNEPELFQRMRVLDDTEKFSYAEKGKICLTVKNSLTHRERINPETGEGCTWTEWVRLAAPWSYATCFAAVRDMEALADVPMQDLAEIPSINFAVMKQLSTAVRNSPTVLQAAKTKRSDEFIEHIAQNHPDQHIEAKQTFRFVADESQAAPIKKALARAMERGATTMTQALMDICINYEADALIEEFSKVEK